MQTFARHFPREQSLSLGKLFSMASRTRAWLTEDITRSRSAHRVDRDKGVIFGVKVLGTQSSNRRVYDRQALQEAYSQRLYEGCPVNVNHPKKATDPRDAHDRFGRLINVRLEPDGLYADLEYLKSHPLADRICEAAERMPEAFGLSHNAQGDVEKIDGIDHVRRLIEVRSCDLVSDPASTGGLFEGKRPMKIRDFFEGLSELVKAKLPKRARHLQPLLEDSYMDADMPAEAGGAEPAAPAATSDPAEALKQGFRAAIQAIMDDDTLDAAAKGKRITKYLRTHEKLTGNDDAGEETEEPEEVEEEEEEEPGKKKECKEGGGGAAAAEMPGASTPGSSWGSGEKHQYEQRNYERLVRKEKVQDLCEQAGLAPDKQLLALLAEMPTEEAARQLIDREKRRGKVKAPRSGNTALTEQHQTEASIEGAMSLLRS